MALTLPERPAQYLTNEILLPGWQPSEARGFDATLSDPSAEAFIPVATSIDDVGAIYPSIVVQYSNETSGGESTYDFVTQDGPGQTRTGELLVTARAQDHSEDYVGDSAAYAAAEADDIVAILTETVENVVQRNAGGGTTEFQTLGSQRGPDIPDDYDQDPPVRLADAQVSYSWSRRP